MRRCYQAGDTSFEPRGALHLFAENASYGTGD